mmetsp:Transcript_18135/g.50396  ORF Transcript_18135/g.50396 Transcript_18135/m.50396 type:complete len:203 (+) Transcript_18135:406-1014(+)
MRFAIVLWSGNSATNLNSPPLSTVNAIMESRSGSQFDLQTSSLLKKFRPSTSSYALTRMATGSSLCGVVCVILGSTCSTDATISHGTAWSGTRTVNSGSLLAPTSLGFAKTHSNQGTSLPCASLCLCPPPCGMSQPVGDVPGMPCISSACPAGGIGGGILGGGMPRMETSPLFTNLHSKMVSKYSWKSSAEIQKKPSAEVSG